jgi:hypothetical protein
MSWCYQNGKDPHSTDVRYVYNARTLTGIDNPCIEYYGDYYLRDDFEEINKTIKERNRERRI